MNWTRTILDGLAMAAYFNLFAATVALYQPRLMFPSYPPAIIKAANEPPTREETVLLALDLLWRAAASPSLWCGQRCGGRDNRILASIPDGIHPVDDDQHRRSSFSGCVADPEKAKDRFVIPGTEGHPGYAFTDWMKGYALPEHLLQWPLLLCPLMAAAQAGLGLLLQR